MVYWSRRYNVGSDGWQEDYVPYLLSYMNDSYKRVALDIGSSYGWVTTSLANYFDCVIAYEMDTEVYNCAKINCSDYTNIQMHNYAISNVNSESFYKSYNSSGIQKLTNNPVDVPCKTITIDSINLNNIDLIKIDVEGHEFEVLQGLEKTIKRCKPKVIAVEINKTHRDPERTSERRTTIEFVRQFGYDLVDARHYDFIFTRINN